MYWFASIFGLAIALLRVSLLCRGATIPKQKHVVIVGTGPAGLLTAHALLSRPDKAYKVSIFDAREDPRRTILGPRTYSLGLNLRGKGCIQQLDSQNRTNNLWDKIFQQGILSDEFFLHVGSKTLKIRKKPTERERLFGDSFQRAPPSLLIPRNQLCGVMLDALLNEYSDGKVSKDGNSRLNVYLSNKIESIDLSGKTITAADGQKFDYTILVGADGVRSVVRKAIAAMNETINGVPFQSDEYVLPSLYKVMYDTRPEKIAKNVVHALVEFPPLTSAPKVGFNLFVEPAPNNTIFTLVSWNTDKNLTGQAVPRLLRDESPLADLKNAIGKAFPTYGEPTDTALKQLHGQLPSESRIVRCNRYHCNKGAAVIMGDAAHCTGSSLGQGANSALIDAVAFDQCLDDAGVDFCNDSASVDKALVLYSQKQVPEGIALWELLQLPPERSPLWNLVYQIYQFLVSFTQNVTFVRRFFPKPMRTLLSQTTTPFAKIAKKVRN